MGYSCPNIKSREWIELVEGRKNESGEITMKGYGKQGAWLLLAANNWEIPTLEEAEDIVVNTSGTAIQRVRKIYEPLVLSDRVNTVLTMFYEAAKERQNQHPEFTSMYDTLAGNGAEQVLNSVINKLKTLNNNASDSYSRNEYAKMLDNFDGLLDECMLTFETIEGFTFNAKQRALYKVLQTDENDAGVSQNSQLHGENTSDEESRKEGWMYNFRFISVKETLTEEVKRFLHELEMIDKDGNPVLDDLGYIRKINVAEARNVLLKTISTLSATDDLDQMLRDKAKEKNGRYSWINKLLKEFEKNPQMRTMIKVNFNKTFTKMFAISENSKGVFTMLALNAAIGADYLTEEWKTGMQKGIVYNEEYSIYNADGTINKNRAEVVRNAVDKLREDLGKSNKVKEFINERLFYIRDMFNAVGITFDSTEDMLEVFSDKYNNLDKTMISTLLEKVQYIADRAKQDDVHDVTQLAELANSDYKTIATEVAKNETDFIENSVHENNKGYWSYRYTSAIGEMLKMLQNKNGTREQFEKYIKDNFQKYSVYYDEANGKFYNEWLNLLTGKSDFFMQLTAVQNLKGKKLQDKLWELSARYRAMIDYGTLLHANKIEYNDMSDMQKEKASITAYFRGNKDTAWYSVPTLSDAPEFGLFHFVRYTGKDYKKKILEKLRYQVLAEYQRIQEVKYRESVGAAKIDFYDDRGKEFVNFAVFNIAKVGGKSVMSMFDALNAETDPAVRTILARELNDAIDDVLTEVMNRNFAKELEWYEEIELTKPDKNGKLSEFSGLAKSMGTTETEIKNSLEEYFWNTVLFNHNFINLTVGDQAFFKDSTQFNKRIKMVYAPGESLDVEARFVYTDENGHTETIKPRSEFQNIMVLKDNKIEAKNVLKEVLWQIDNNKALSATDKESLKKSIIKQYSEVNETDAQSYRTIESARDVMIMAGKWRPFHERAYKRIMKGKWSMEDYEIFFVNFKPFTSGFQETKWTDANGKERVTKTPIQHKTSEIILFPFGMFGEKSDSKLAGMYQFMTGKDSKGKQIRTPVDLILFESAVKVGGHSKIDLNGTNGIEDTKQALIDAQTAGKVQSVHYSNYRLIQPVNEHLQTTSNLYGSQIRKLIFENFKEEDEFNVNGHTLNYDQARDRYNRLINENLANAFQDLVKTFGSIEEIHKMLQKEVTSNPRYNNDLLNALQLETYVDEKGNTSKRFALPLYDPVQSSRIQQLLYSVIASKITKQKISGGACIQVSQFGIKHPEKVNDQINSIHEQLKAITKQRKVIKEDWRLKNLDYQETKLKADLERLVKEAQSKSEDNNKLNIVFNTDHSISHYEALMPFWLKKYFTHLADENGEIDISRIDDEALRMVGYRIPSEGAYSTVPIKIVGFLPNNGGNNIILPSEITTIMGADFDVDKLFVMIKQLEAYNPNTGEKVATVDLNTVEDFRIRPIEYDINADVDTLTKAQRDNQLIDIEMSTLNHVNNAFHMLNPGGFETLKEIKKELYELMGILEENMDVTLPSVQNYFHLQNAVAGKLIGKCANNTVAHAICKQFNLSFNLPPFGINGKWLQNFSGKGTRASGTHDKNLKEFTASAVDAVKDPVMRALNFDLNTSNMTLCLIRLGYELREAIFFMNQPVIREFASRLNRDNMQSRDKLIGDLLGEKEKQLKGLSPKIDFDPLSNRTNFSSSSLKDDIKSWYQNPSSRTDVELLKRQYQVLANFKKLMGYTTDMMALNAVVKADTSTEAVGPDIATTYKTLDKVAKAFELLKKNPESSKYISGLYNMLHSLADVTKRIYSSWKVDNKTRKAVYKTIKDPVERKKVMKQLREEAKIKHFKEIKEFINNHPLGMLAGFIEYGLLGSSTLMNQYFPETSYNWKRVIDTVQRHSVREELSEKLIKDVYNAIYEYYMGNFEEFENGYTDEETGEWTDTRNWYIETFPKEFQEQLAEDETLSSLSLMQAFSVGFKGIQFRNAGKLDTNLVNEFKRQWESLYYNPEYTELAVDLIKYSFYKNGFGFGPNTFTHLVPVELWKNMEGYRDNLYRIKSWSDAYMDGFKTDDIAYQFMLRNLNNRELVKNIADHDSKSEFIDSKTGEPLDMVSLEGSYIPKEYFVSFPHEDKENGLKKAYYEKYDDGDNWIVYKRIYPKNNFEYGFDGTSKFAGDKKIGEIREVDETLPQVSTQQNLTNEVSRELDSATDNVGTSNEEMTDTVQNKKVFKDGSILQIEFFQGTFVVSYTAGVNDSFVEEYVDENDAYDRYNEVLSENEEVVGEELEKIFSAPHKVNISEYKKTSRDGTITNYAYGFTVEGKPNEVFELVKDIEVGYWSVHFKTTGQSTLNEEEKVALIKKMAEFIPVGDKLSTWGKVTKGGMSGLQRFTKHGFVKIDTREHEGEKIPVYMKESSEQGVHKPSIFNNFNLPKNITDLIDSIAAETISKSKSQNETKTVLEGLVKKNKVIMNEVNKAVAIFKKQVESFLAQKPDDLFVGGQGGGTNPKYSPLLEAPAILKYISYIHGGKMTDAVLDGKLKPSNNDPSDSVINRISPEFHKLHQEVSVYFAKQGLKGVEFPISSQENNDNTAETINIYAGTGENAELSNFAIRPFTSESVSTGWEIDFQSVEQAFQYVKGSYGAANENARIQNRMLSTTNGAKLKKLGREIRLTDDELENWNRDSSGVMKFFIKQSFEQNPDALKKLLDTGNAILTHTQDKGKWGKEFPRILMEIRAEFMGNTNVTSRNIIEAPQQTPLNTVTEYTGEQLETPWNEFTKEEQDEIMAQEAGIYIRELLNPELNNEEPNKLFAFNDDVDYDALEEEYNKKQKDYEEGYLESLSQEEKDIIKEEEEGIQFQKDLAAGRLKRIDPINKNSTKVYNESNLLKDGRRKRFDKKGAITMVTSKNNNTKFNTKYYYRKISVGDGYYEIIIYEKVKAPSLFSQKSLSDSNINNKIEAAKRLKSVIMTMLKKAGFSVGALEQFEIEAGISGEFDPSKIKGLPEQLRQVIRIANGLKGDVALVEEFAHLVENSLRGEPMMQRMTKYLAEHPEVVKAIFELEGEGMYERYLKEYGGDHQKMLTEAVGKMIKRGIFLNEQKRIEQESGNKSIVQRFLNWIRNTLKNMFNKVDMNIYEKELVEADQMFSEFAADLIDGKYQMALNANNIIDEDKLYSLATDVAQEQVVLKKMIDNSIKRLSILSANKGSGSRDAGIQNKKIRSLEAKLARGKSLEATLEALENAVSEMKYLKQRLDKQLADDNGTRESVAKTASMLMEMKGYLDANYDVVTEIIGADYLHLDTAADDSLEKKINKTAIELQTLMNPIKQSFLKNAKTLLIRLFKPFFGNAVKINLGNGKTVTLQDIVNMSDTDINFVERYLMGVAEGTNPFLKLIDQVVKLNKAKARKFTLLSAKTIVDARNELIKAGYKNQDWMFERDADGKPTGYWVMDRNYTKFQEAEKAFIKELELRIPGHDTVATSKRTAEIVKWNKIHTEIVDGRTVPNRTLYTSTVYENFTDAQKKFYHSILNVKIAMDKKLPADRTSLFLAPQVRKSFSERFKATISEGGVWGNVSSAVGDLFKFREDEDEYGNSDTIRTDFTDREIHILPVYYTNEKGIKDKKNLSLDVVSTMIMYADMANNFGEMSQVVDALELGRTVIQAMKIKATRGSTPLKSILRRDKKSIETPAYVNSEASNIMGRYDDFMRMQVYGKYKKNEGGFGKTIDLVNNLVSLNGMAFNSFSAIANVLQGRAQMRIESLSGQFFNMDEVKRADVNIARHLPAVFAELGNISKKDKLSLWNEDMNVMNDYEKAVRSVQAHKKTWLEKGLDFDSMFFMTNAGEFWMNTRTSLAVAERYMVKDKNGKIISLWDAYEVVKSATGNTSSLQLQAGVTKLDGTPFTEYDRIKFVQKVHRLNEKMHGIYNKDDMSAFQQHAIGRLVFTFRKYMVSSIMRRFQKSSYDFMLDETTEGYYVTMWKFLKTIKQGKFQMKKLFDALDPVSKYNMKRAMTELGIYLLTAFLGALMLGMGWDEEDKPLANYALFGALRLKQELGMFVPWISMPGQWLKTVQSPAAAFNWLENVGKFTWQVATFQWFDTIKTGKYAGDNKLISYFFRTLPAYRFIANMENVSKNVLPFYK